MSVGSVRRSSRLSAAVLPQASPCSNALTPRRITRRSLALAQTPVLAVASPSQPVLHLAHLRLTLDQTPTQASQSPRVTPHSSKKKKDTVNVSLCVPSVKEVHSDDTQPDESPAQQSETVSTQDNTASVPELGTPMLVDSLPPISAAEEQVDIPLCPRLSLSPCKTPPLSSQGPKPSSSLSFTLSPCVTPTQPSISSHTPVQTPVEAQESVCHTPDSSVVEVNNTWGFCFCIEKSQPHVSLLKAVIHIVLSDYTINYSLVSLGNSGVGL